MSNLERKVDLLVKLALEEENAARVAAFQELKSVNELESSVAYRKSFSLDKQIEQLLIDIGVPVHIRGFRDLTVGIRLVVEERGIGRDLISRVYPAIAQKRGKSDSASKVERGIRHAIECAWDRVDPDTIEKFFGNTISPMKGKPTNKEFISRCAMIVTEQMDAEWGVSNADGSGR